MTKNTVIMVPVLTLVTPELAQKYLDSIELNRSGPGSKNWNRAHVRRLQSDIENDRWVVTHQGIALDVNGRLVDGEHRCRAIIAANKAVYVFVTTGISRESIMDAVDQGKARTGAQSLIMRGVTSATFKSAVCRQIAVLTRPNLTYTGTLTNAETNEVYENHKSSIDEFAKTKSFPAPYYAPLVLWHEVDPQAAVSFDTPVKTGVMCDGTLAALKKQLENRKAEGGSQSIKTLLSTISAIENYLEDKSVKKVRINLTSYKSFIKRFNLPLNPSLAAYAAS